ncbi:MAG: ATP-binding protein [Bacilli bacterium]|nr:ATP-binding protein [Bacilli bacterium]
MLGTILEIVENNVVVNLSVDISRQPNLVGLHVVFEDGNKKIVGQIDNINKEQVTISIVGEIQENSFLPGNSSKPSFASKVRIIDISELGLIFGDQEIKDSNAYLGISNVYENYRVTFDINSFFSNHFAILGNSGSGKSYTVAGILQRLFTETPNPPLYSNIVLFDAYGEYTTAFSKLNSINNNLNYKVYTTDTSGSSKNEILRIPPWLLDVDDLALILDATSPNQLPIIEKTLKLVPILSGNGENVIKYKNDIIARAILDILLSGMDSTKIRDQVIAILTKFNTEQLSLDSKISQPGYIRTLNQCLFIDKTGKLQEMELVVDFISSFIDDSLSLNSNDVDSNSYYTFEDLEYAMDFALISEGVLKSNRVYETANVLMVRLHSINNSFQKEYFKFDRYIIRNDYIRELMSDNGKHCQIVNFNISYVDDRFAKVITKIISKILFKEVVESKNRGSVPYHIIMEEAHRYVQNDRDINIIGYNIFDRITKEGRKYGILLGLITQRPSELSDTAISQCSNFIILRMSHPLDLDYIRKMVPNVSDEIVDKLKNLKPGNCVAFGSAFKVPIFAHVERPNPEPLSQNVDIVKAWKTRIVQQTTSINSIDMIQNYQQSIPEVESNTINEQIDANSNKFIIPSPNDVIKNVEENNSDNAGVSSVFRSAK